MNLTYGDIIAIVLTALLTGLGWVLSLKVGYHCGYWRRVREEKDARGIR